MRALHPTLTLGEILGTDLVYSPRASPNGCAWLPPSAAVLDGLTGGQLAVVGDMPVLCAAGVSSPEALGLLRDAGLPVPANLIRYADGADCLRRLAELSGSARKIVLQHVHPAADLAPEACWIPPATLSFLNNKRNLGELVPAPNRPERRILAREHVAAAVSPEHLPVVLKAATDESTGGGLDVLVCLTPEQLERAAGYFNGCTHVVAENFVPIRRNLCLNYAVTRAGETIYLGCAEQVSDTEGRYHGNWIDAASQAPADAVEAGRAVARAGAERGYWGIVGLDMAVTEDDRLLVFDLNFRINGSTAALLLARSVRETLGRPVLRMRSWRGTGTYGELLKAAYTALARDILLPLNSYDPTAGGEVEAPPRLSGLLLGRSREEVTECERELAALGLVG